ncbi:MAG: FAD-dependent oxidoreductase [Polyangia bacterium]
MSTTVEVFVPLTELPAARPTPTPPASGDGAGDAAGADDPGQAAVHTDVEQALYARALLRAAEVAGIPRERIEGGRFLRKSLDARKGFPMGFRVQLEVFCHGEQPGPALAEQRWPPGPGQGSWRLLRGGGLGRLAPPVALSQKRRVVVVGAGPAGTFAALRLSQAGVEVTLCEQGQPVQPRRHGLAAITRGRLVPDSNYCFGEGGAGTFSDGKLYTRSKDREAIGETLATLIEHGADPEIGVESRPHIGSNRLPKILVAMRTELERLGVSYRWGTAVVDLILSPSGQLRGVRTAPGEELPCDAVVLAVGHSARPVYELLRRRGVLLQPKAFAVGVRVEHPQPLINRIQYGRAAEHPALPTAFYQIAAQARGRGVYSFCMCPGGWVVPASTEPEALCTNGMSLSRRDSPLANAALVVTIEPADFARYGSGPDDVLAGIEFQRALERAAFAAGGGSFVAPAHRLTDFVAGRPPGLTAAPLRSSYRPSVRPGDLLKVLPEIVREPLREAVRAFDRSLPGFLSAEAQLVGVETRTSAPVRIVRDPGSLQSPSLAGLFPVAEGAGYAGGIVSAAGDGLRAADAVLAWLGR